MSVIRNIINRSTFILTLYNDSERKPFFIIIKEIICLFIKQKTLPGYYFSRRLYKKGINNIHDYMPNKVMLPLHEKLNNQSSAHVLNNKLFFHLFYGQFFRNLTKILMYNNQEVFVIDKRPIVIKTIAGFESVLHDLTNYKSSTKSIFIKKTRGSYGGANTYRISSEDFPLERIFTEELFSEIKKSAFLFQETISQHAELARLNPSCINTIRMDTFIDREGNVEIISPYLRMSTTNLHVDNTSSGGCFVGIEPDGKLKKFGYTSISKTGGKIITIHPVTGVKFLDFEIPYYLEAKELILEVAGIIPDLRLIGWDIAITEGGPLLIEGNDGYDITNHDLTYGGYRTNPVFRKVLNEMGIS